MSRVAPARDPDGAPHGGERAGLAPCARIAVGIGCGRPARVRVVREAAVRGGHPGRTLGANLARVEPLREVRYIATVAYKHDSVPWGTQ